MRTFTKEDIGKYIQLNRKEKYFGSKGLVKIVGIRNDGRDAIIELPYHGSRVEFNQYLNTSLYTLDPDIKKSNYYFTIDDGYVKEVIDTLPVGTVVKTKDGSIVKLTAYFGDNYYTGKIGENNNCSIYDKDIQEIVELAPQKPKEAVMEKHQVADYSQVKVGNYFKIKGNNNYHKVYGFAISNNNGWLLAKADEVPEYKSTSFSLDRLKQSDYIIDESALQLQCKEVSTGAIEEVIDTLPAGTVVKVNNDAIDYVIIGDGKNCGRKYQCLLKNGFHTDYYYINDNQIVGIVETKPFNDFKDIPLGTNIGVNVNSDGCPANGETTKTNEYQIVGRCVSASGVKGDYIVATNSDAGWRTKSALFTDHNYQFDNSLIKENMHCWYVNPTQIKYCAANPIKEDKASFNDLPLGTIVEVSTDEKGNLSSAGNTTSKYRIIGCQNYSGNDMYYVYEDIDPSHTTLKLRNPDRLREEGFSILTSVKEGATHHWGRASYIKGFAQETSYEEKLKEKNKETARAEVEKAQRELKEEIAQKELQIKELEVKIAQAFKDEKDKISEAAHKFVEEKSAVKLSEEQIKNLPFGTIITANDFCGKGQFQIIGYSSISSNKTYLCLPLKETDDTASIYKNKLINYGWILDPSLPEKVKGVALIYSGIIEIISLPKASDNFTSMIKSDLKDTAYRIAVAQLTKAAKSAILMALQSQGSKKSQINAITSMLDTEMGSAVLSVIIGLFLTYAPSISDNAKAKILAEEFRVAGITIAGNELADVLFTNVLPVLIQAVSSLPKEETKLRIEEPKEELSQEEIIETAKEQSIN